MAIPLEHGGGDQFAVNPQTLRDAAPTYHKAAQDVSSLEQSLISSIQMASGDMFLLIEFAQLASRLDQLQQRINIALECASMGLNRIGTALSMAADEYQNTDEQVSQTFKGIENDPTPWNMPAITFPYPIVPGANPGGTPGPIGPVGPVQQPGLRPGRQPQPGPGVLNPEPQLPPLEPGPGLILP